MPNQHGVLGHEFRRVPLFALGNVKLALVLGHEQLDEFRRVPLSTLGNAKVTQAKLCYALSLVLQGFWRCRIERCGVVGVSRT